MNGIGRRGRFNHYRTVWGEIQLRVKLQQEGDQTRKALRPNPQKHTTKPAKTYDQTRMGAGPIEVFKNEEGRYQKTDHKEKHLEEAIPLAVKAFKVLRPSTSDSGRRDRKVIAVAAVLTVTRLSERWFEDVLAGVDTCNPANRMPYFVALCRDRCTVIHPNECYQSLESQTVVPRWFYQRWNAALRSRLATPVVLHRPPASEAEHPETARQRIQRELAAIVESS